MSSLSSFFHPHQTPSRRENKHDSMNAALCSLLTFFGVGWEIKNKNKRIYILLWPYAPWGVTRKKLIYRYCRIRELIYIHCRRIQIKDKSRVIDIITNHQEQPDYTYCIISSNLIITLNLLVCHCELKRLYQVTSSANTKPAFRPAYFLYQGLLVKWIIEQKLCKLTILWSRYICIYYRIHAKTVTEVFKPHYNKSVATM